MIAGCRRAAHSTSAGRWLLAWTVASAGWMTAAPLVGDESPSQAASEQPVSYTVEVIVLTQPQPQYGIRAQEWGRVFRQLGYSPRFRDTRRGDTIGISETVRGQLGTVTAVASMNSDGVLQFGDRKFALADSAELVAMLDELRKFGAYGPIERRPRWGLSDEQFAAMTKLLSEPAEAPVELKSVIAAADSLQLPRTIRLTFTEAARKQIAGMAAEPDAGAIELNGLSKGTALALTLAQFGLGFRPMRNSAGTFDLQVDAGNETDNLWPIGWRAVESVTRIVPAYSKGVEVGVEDVELTGLLTVIAGKLNLPHYYSAHELEAAGIDIQSLTYTRRTSRVSPASLLTIIGRKFEMGLDVRVDENGKPFLWITTTAEYRAFLDRFDETAR